MELLPNRDIEYADFKIIFRSYARGSQMPFHTDPAPRLSIVVFGELEEHTLQYSARAHPFSVVAKPEGITHRNRFGSRGARLVSIVFEEETFLPLAEAAGLPAWQWFHSWEAARESVQLLIAINNEADEKEVKEKTIQLMASLLPERPVKQKTPPLWLQYIAERVEENCHENLLVQGLAEEAGVHPVYLARAFRKHYGCSVKEYQHRQRLQRSLNHLASQEASLSHLAYDFGYADQAHFSRTFKREAGLSPGQFRELLRKIN
ncbi:MAG: helix-turn-helix transcriptional regulator [Phaeodactylibacter sp.]|nr:helix-turn-helix transcriptional regulator [Phaeodactylibacter sp.]